jgi:hypothetical protein
VTHRVETLAVSTRRGRNEITEAVPRDWEHRSAPHRRTVLVRVSGA